MSQSGGPAPAIDDLFRCFICLGKVTDARLCPSCSGLCCAVCIEKWLTQGKSSCPHCRCPLRVEHLVSCRFLAEITQAIEKLQTTDREEPCADHNTPLSYYCATCAALVCSDCAMFESKHRGHEFQKLDAVYETKVAEVRKEAEALHTRLKQLSGTLEQVEGLIERVHVSKSTQLQEIVSFFERLQKDLDEALQAKMVKLVDARGKVAEEASRLERINCELAELLGGQKSKLIAQTPQLLTTLRAATVPCLSPTRMPSISLDFSSDVCPPYVSSTFVISNYSLVRKSVEVMYSDPLLTYGMSWRLKVYPNGNGVSQGTHLSVFLELVKGSSAKYEYKVELVGTDQTVTREFASEFEPGECWGYNRFFALESIAGYCDQEDTLTFRFAVRPQSYAQLSADQHQYILALETDHRELAAEIQMLQAQLQAHAAVLQSHDNPLSCLEEVSQPDSEGHVQAVIEKFMITPEESVSEDSDDYPCVVWDSPVSPNRWRSTTSHLDSPPNSL